ncbi:hypothetical protein BDW75DRAFT_225838 [Aspergillus navahoensis]
MSSQSGHAQTIVVTGANRGIGLSIVKQLLSQSGPGTLIIGVDMADEQLKLLKSSSPDKFDHVTGDISQRSTSEKTVALAKERSGRLDTLVLNAGVLRPVGLVADISVDELKKLFDVNFFALFHTIQLALPELRRNHGKIIMTSSGVTDEPSTAWVAYACSKAAMNYLAASIPLEEPDVTTVCLAPGIVDTGIQKAVRDEHQQTMPEDQYKWLADLHAKGELLSPDLPASTFVKLALHGIPKDVAGKMVYWNDPRVKA